MKRSKAIVTLAVGKVYQERWESLCRANWQQYADKHGYDLICIDTPLDNSERAKLRSPAWQKCLILSQEITQQYERVVWIDSDILINSSSSPCIVQNVPIDKVGAVEMYSSPTPSLSKQALERLYEFWGSGAVINYTAQDFYSKYGFECDFDRVVQTGVMIFSPPHHRQLLEKVYYDYEERKTGQWNYEMRPLSYELIKANSVHWIDHKFNLCWLEYKAMYYPFLMKNYQGDSSLLAQLKRKLNLNQEASLRFHRYEKLCANTAYINSFFLHFAGCASDMTLVNLEVKSWHDLTLDLR